MKAIAILFTLLLCHSLSAQIIQSPSHSGGVVSDGSSYIACDDFRFTNTTRIYGVTWWGKTNGAAGQPEFAVAVLSEFLGQPGATELYLPATPTTAATGEQFSSGQPEVRYEVYFPTSFVAQANGRYW